MIEFLLILCRSICFISGIILYFKLLGIATCDEIMSKINIWVILIIFVLLLSVVMATL